MHFPLPQRIHESDELGNVAAVSFGARPPTLRERVNQPFEALAHRSSRRRRLNGGLTLGGRLGRANLKLRPSELRVIQGGFFLRPPFLFPLRFGLRPRSRV